MNCSASDWSNFSAARHSGASNLGVEQPIGVYTDRGAARQAFDALKISARQCRTQYPADVFGPGYTVIEPDGATLQVLYPEDCQRTRQCVHVCAAPARVG